MSKFSRKNLAFNIISAMVLLLLVFSLMVSIIGYSVFTESLERVYSETTYRMADTAVTLVNGDRIDDYLAEGGTSEDFLQTKEYLETYCRRMDVSIVYVIKVDTSDYGRFTSVFNAVGEDTPYTPWEIGYQQDTTNEEYAAIYKGIYEEGLACGTVYRTTKLNGAPPHITTLVPVKNTQGEVVSVMCIQRAMSELRDGRRPYLISIAVSTVMLAVLVSLSSAYYINQEFVRPLRRVLDETTRFARENQKGETLGAVSTINEIASLGHAVDAMETEMLEYIENLTSFTAEKERIGAELSIAGTIQENAVPNTFPAFPERNEFEIFATMTTAKEVGGDFYNFFLVDDDHLAIVMADVSGKGIPAALFMMVTNILISDRTRMGGTPAEILTFVNDSICEHNRADMFVTVWLGILEISTGKMIAANAGHDDPAICRKDGYFETLTNKHDLVIGAMKEVQYRNFEVQLHKGDKLFLYTDGLPEATDGNNRMLTLEGMLRLLNQHKDKAPQAILDGVNQGVNAFVGDAPQFDDLTMLCLELKAPTDDGVLTLTVDATTENLQRVTDFVDNFLEEKGASMKTQLQVDLAVEEIFVNIANYAYGDGTGTAEVSVSEKNGVITIVMKDSGIPYNPLIKEDPDITLSAEERDIGGLGVFLTKQNMDEVTYRCADGMNVLTMKKQL